MKKREVLTSIKDEKLIVERRNQMIKGPSRYLRKKVFTEQQQGKLPKPLGSVSVHFTNIFNLKKMFYILYVTTFTTK